MVINFEGRVLGTTLWNSGQVRLKRFKWEIYLWTAFGSCKRAKQ
jgi:hypothetical protein